VSEKAETHKTTVFIETSMMIQRFAYGQRRRNEIEASLMSKSTCTSDYVLMEFRRSFLQAQNYLRSLFLKMVQQGKTEIRLNELFVILSQARSIFHSTRAVQSILLALSSIFRDDMDRLSLNPAEMARELALQIDRFETEARKSVDEVINHIHCDLTQETVQIGDYIHSRLSCNARRAKCQLVPFLSAHREQLLTIQQAMESAPREKVDQRTLSALRRVNTDVTKALGERACWALGDVIITLEVPEYAFIYTADGHFEVISKAIGKQLFVEEK